MLIQIQSLTVSRQAINIHQGSISSEEKLNHGKLMSKPRAAKAVDAPSGVATNCIGTAATNVQLTIYELR
jgi:hypothetical protein